MERHLDLNLRERTSTLKTFYSVHLSDWSTSVLLFPLCLYFALTRGEYGILDNADLIIHEAGHFFFMWFGTFVHIAGGTLMQLLLPSLLVWHFWRHEYRFGAQVSLLWLGHNLINISVYAADARARVLPLLGGDKAGHDWWHMLTMLGMLEYDQLIGWMFYSLAILVFAWLLFVPRFLWR